MQAAFAAIKRRIQLIKCFFQHKMSIQIYEVFTEIKKAFKQYYSPKQRSTLLTSEQLNLLQILVFQASQSSQQMLKSVLGGQRNSNILKIYVLERLSKRMSQAQLLKDYYKAQLEKVHSSYRISTQNRVKMMKNIHDSLTTIEQQMKNIKNNIGILRDGQTMMEEKWIIKNQQMQLCPLIRMLVESSDLDLEKEKDQMVFRIFMLWESLGIVLQKTQHVIDQLMDQGVQENKSEISSPSTKTKRSALSESVEIFKMNKKKRQEEERRSKTISLKDKKVINLIRSDYQLQCREVSKEAKAEKRQRCCFG